jgi:hypothetical protein
MYFRSVIRVNPVSHEPEGYYRLVESYRNEGDRICHRTLLTVGFLSISVEKLNRIQRILNDRLKNITSLFEETDSEVQSLAEKFWNQLVSGGKIDVSAETEEKKKRMIDLDSIKHKDVREIGGEWICYQTINQLNITEKLKSLGWDDESTQLAITQIISRAVYPFSEYRTTRWIKENSSVCEITGYPLEKITKDKLYKSALDLYKIKDSLEAYLSKKTNELFDLEDKIILYDLTNTYFEGRKAGSEIAKFGRSKEKRNDCKLVVLALVINSEGFVKYSNVFEGNTSDSASLPVIIDNIRARTSTEKRAIVVLDAGIATEENLALLEAKGYDYVCVSRSKIKDYEIDPEGRVQEIVSQNKDIITLEKIKSAQTTDYLLKVKSPGKALKEASMNQQFEQRFKLEITKISTSLHKKNGVKKLDKVHQRVGRAIGKYPSIAKHYQIEVLSENDQATDIILHEQKSYEENQKQTGSYFIRTNLQTKEENTIWTIYNTIREIEDSFRCLKTDLDLRPIYHKNDNASMAHLHLGLLAYWLVNTIRYQLKAQNIKHNWQEIIRIANTQKIITTTGNNTFGETIQIRRCSEPDEKLKNIYLALKYKNYPFVRKKSVVPKTLIKKNQNPESQHIKDG